MEMKKLSTIKDSWNTKSVLLGLIFMLSMFSVFGALTDNNQIYYSLDDNDLTGSNPLDLSGNGRTGTTNGATTGIDGKLLQGFSFDGINDYVNSTYSPIGLTSFTLNLWANVTSATSGTEILFGSTESGKNRLYLGFATTQRIQLSVGNSASSVITLNSANNKYTLNDWNMITAVYDGSTIEIFVNNVSVGSAAQSGTINIGYDFLIGAYNNQGSDSNYFNGRLDELSFWDRNLSDTEIGELYNNDLAFNPYGSTPATGITFNNPTQSQYINDTSFLLNVSFSTITNSTYILNAGSETTLGTNTNESTTTLIGIEGLNNISVFTNTSGILSNSSITFTIDTTNPIINNTLPLEINSYFLNISNYVTCSDTNIFTCEITFQPDNQTYAVNQTPLVNFTYNGNQTYDIILTDLANNSVTENGTILINPVTNITFFDINGTQITDYTLGGLSFTDTTNISFYNSVLEVGTNNTLLFEKLGYNSGNITFELLNDSRININYTIPFAEITFFFVDITDGSVIDDQNITLEIIGSTFSQEYEVNETSNYTLVEPLITAGTYTTSVVSQDYSVVFRNFEYDNQQNLTLVIYMTPKVVVDEVITDLIVQVQDTYKSTQPDIPVIQYIWQSDIGQYVIVNEKVSNGFGQTTFSVFLDTKLYQFCAEYNNQLFCESGVTIDASTIVLPLTIDLLAPVVVNNSEIYFKTFTNNLFNTSTNTTIQVDFTWNNQLQDVNEYCLSIQERNFNTLSYLFNNCSTTHSGGLTYLISINENSTYIASSYIKIGNDERRLDQLFLNVVHALQQELIANGFHIIVALLLLFGAIGVGYNKKIHNVSITHILLPLISIVVFITFPIIHNIETVFIVTLVNIVAYTMVTKTFEKNESANIKKIIFILMIYLIFISSLIVFLGEMESKGQLDERGEIILDYLNPDNLALRDFLDNTTTNLQTQQTNSKEGDFDVFNIVFTKGLGFLDTFFNVMAHIFTIVTTMAFLLGVSSEFFTLFIQAVNVLLTFYIFLLFMKSVFGK